MVWDVQAGMTRFVLIFEQAQVTLSLVSSDLETVSFPGAVKRKVKTTTETHKTQRIAELRKGGEYKVLFLPVFSVFSVPLW
jgi:hypothetical protein